MATVNERLAKYTDRLDIDGLKMAALSNARNAKKADSPPKATDDVMERLNKYTSKLPGMAQPETKYRKYQPHTRPYNVSLAQQTLDRISQGVVPSPDIQNRITQQAMLQSKSDGYSQYDSKKDVPNEKAIAAQTTINDLRELQAARQAMAETTNRSGGYGLGTVGFNTETYLGNNGQLYQDFMNNRQSLEDYISPEVLSRISPEYLKEGYDLDAEIARLQKVARENTVTRDDMWNTKYAAETGKAELAAMLDPNYSRNVIKGMSTGTRDNLVGYFEKPEGYSENEYVKAANPWALYDYMTPDEKNTYYYYVGRDGEFEARHYLEQIERKLNARSAEAQQDA